MNVRSFLAIELTETARNALKELRSKLALPQFDVRWVGLENIHLTLRFFGEVAVEDISKISEAARLAAQNVAPFQVSIRGAGAFPNTHSPRVVWTGIEDPGPVLHLEKLLAKELDRTSLPQDNKPFHPHITLGRVKSSRGRRELQQCLERNRDQPVGQLYVDHISLIKSDLHPSGPVYTPIDRFFFSLSREP